MRQRLLSILLLVSLLFTFAAPPAASAQAPANAPDSSKGEARSTGYIIKFKDADKGRKALGKLNKKNIKAFRHLPKHATAALSPEEADELRKDPNVAYVEKDSLVQKAGDIVTPNLTQIHVPEAQAEDIYGDGVKVAVLDTGISATSAELYSAGGISFVPSEPSTDDTNGHGTFVAGLLAALQDDQGLIGVAPHASLYNVKVLDGSGSGTYSQVIQGIEWAIDNQMDIVVMSFAGTEDSAALEEAMQDAYDSGILLVAATGNAGTSTVAYPAKFSSVIGVGAVDDSNQLAPFSNTGAEVELVAPGVGVQGLSLHQGTVNLSGTSVAVPQVAGVAALVKSAHPTYSNQELRNILRETATPLGPSDQYGSGLVNAAGALQIPQQTNPTPTPIPSPSSSPVPVESGSGTNSAVLTVAGLAAQYAVSEEEIAAQLNLGYSLQEIRQALAAQDASPSEMTLADRLNILNPAVQQHNNAYNYSTAYLEPQPDTYTPSYPNEAAANVTDDTYGAEQQVSIAADIPTNYDAFAVAQTSTKVDSAPYSISSGAESISTVDGSLQVQSTDLTLPGRGGMGFALNRIYSSTDANYYDRRGEATVYYLMKYNPEFRVIIEQWQGGDTYTLYQDTTFSAYLYFQNNGHPFSMNTPYTITVMEHDEDGEGAEKRMWESTEFKARDVATDPPYAIWPNLELNGVTYRAKLYPTGHLLYVPGYAVGDENRWSGYYNHNLPQDLETRFPIGKGWRWDIPYVESKNGRNYVHLQGGASYELDSSSFQLMNYPWKDLRMQRDYSSVTVEGINSYFVLISIHGQKQFFSSDGRLLRIQDAYNNVIDFYYTATTSHNLTKIKDVIGNEINITYTTGQVTLTQGDRTVQYIKTKDPQGNKDLLTSVVDAGGRTTRYTYDIAPASYDLVGAAAMKENYTALLKEVYHPTQARSVYTYETFTRSLGPTAKEQTSRIGSREEAVDYVNGSTETFNHVNFTYAGDSGANVRYPSNFSTTRSDGLTQTTYAYKKSYLNDATPSVFYNQKITQQAGTEKQETQQTFDEAHQRAVPTQVTVTHTSGTTVSPAATVTRTYDDYGNVINETDPENHTSTYTYDANTHRLLSQLEPINSTLSRLVQYQRNAQGSVTQLTVRDATPTGVAGDLKSQVNYAYDSFGNAVQVTLKDDNRDTVINRSYSPSYSFPLNQSTSVTDVTGQSAMVTETMQYNRSTGAMTTYTDGKGNATTYQYDTLGRLKKATFTDNSQINVTYDDVNNKVTAVDPTGLTTVTQWDPLGRKTSEGISGSGTTTYGYNAYGRTVWAQDALGHRTSFGYDAWGRLTQTVYPDGFTAGVAYDDVHFIVTSTDAESNQTRETYDLLKRLVKKEWLKASGPVTLGSYTYDFAGNPLTSTDGNQNTTTYAYDALGRLTTVTDALAQTTSYAYSLANQLTQIHYADGNTLQKQYDEMGRLIKSIDPSGQAETYVYDANSNLLKHTDRNGHVQTNVYNNRNLLTSSQLGTETITYSYDAAGRRLSMQDATGMTAYAYDPVTKQLSSLTYPDGRTVAYQFDAQGNRTQMTDPFGKATAYGYDSRNRLTGVGAVVGNWDETYTYKKNDLLSTVQQANGMNWTYGYDGVNLTSLTQRNGSNTVVNSFSYSYDNNFNQISKTENGASSTYTYDPLNRIGTASPFQEQYSYDARGNRQTMQTSKLLDLGGANYTYDERNRLTQVTTEDGKTVSYRYNGDGMLYERTENGVTTRYYYDGADMIAEGTVTGGSVTLKARYVRGNGLAVRVDAAGSKQYYLSNGHGDVVGLFDATGSVINQYTYDLWGSPLTTSETVRQPFRYSGEMWDSSANLQYLRARWYSPAMGLFINEDMYTGQIDNPLSLNLYTYVENNPLTHTDPTGHMGVENLRRLSGLYNAGTLSASSISAAVISANGKGIWTALHEIAQVNIAKKLNSMGLAPTLEQEITSKTKKNWLGRFKRYEADVVVEQTNEVWEVKPILGKDPKKQLELYKSEGGYVEGRKLDTIRGIPVIGSINMKIQFPENGAAIYSFYREDKDGNEVYVPSTDVKKEILDERAMADKSVNGKNPSTAWLPVIPGLNIPVPAIP